ncbi:hypothetical protein PVK06_048931 [Gossypium arboreum]|uniref:Reverse transcriptase zinc-binding domain-containing protein n=1 Tax=Gossypium arboreum TaxID=29729 RepID=A0ABR0MHR2_GOSAR|nr:hypothetical protein PVK06_048931 [Gossypium arboreum]
MRGFGSSNACGLCGHDNDDVLYVLKDCHVVRAIWDKLISLQSLSRFYTGFLLEWVTNNFQNHLTSSLGGVDWPCLFEIIVWVCSNTDGSMRIDEGFATDGGCVRDHNDEWIIGFSRYLGTVQYWR